MAPIARSEILRRLRENIANNKPIIGTGAGTGIRPWAQRTTPLPTCTGEATTRSGAIRAISRQAPTTSTMASTAPTS